jgi:hypothetical protein
MTGVPALAIIARMLIVVVGLPFGLYALLTRGRRRAIPQVRGCGGRTGLTVSPAALVWRSDEGVNDGGSVGGRRPNRARRRRNGWTEGEAGTWLEDRDRRPARPARGLDDGAGHGDHEEDDVVPVGTIEHPPDGEGIRRTREGRRREQEVAPHEERRDQPPQAVQARHAEAHPTEPAGARVKLKRRTRLGERV